MFALARNWELTPFPFILCVLIILGLRHLILRRRQFLAMDAESALLAGWILFPCSPLLLFEDLLELHPYEYMAHMVVAYGALLLGLRFIQKKGDDREDTYSYQLAWLFSARATHLATVFSVLYVTVALTIFLVDGGIGRARDLWMSGQALHSFLVSVETERLDATFVGSLEKYLQAVFLLAWAIVFRKRARLGCLLWVLYTIPTIDRYMGRSEILRQSAVPILVLYMQRPNYRKMITTGLTALLPVVLLFLSWFSYFRLGSMGGRPIEGMMDGIVIDFALPGLTGSKLARADGLESDVLNYALAYATFPVPRILWPDKPGDDLNFVGTHYLTGRLVGLDNPVLTFTVMGEAWHYFGMYGYPIFMFTVGAFIGLWERKVRGSSAFCGFHAFLIMQCVIQMRSTVLHLFQTQFPYLLIVAALSLVHAKYHYPRDVLRVADAPLPRMQFKKAGAP